MAALDIAALDPLLPFFLYLASAARIAVSYFLANAELEITVLAMIVLQKFHS